MRLRLHHLTPVLAALLLGACVSVGDDEYAYDDDPDREVYYDYDYDGVDEDDVEYYEDYED